MCVLGGMGRVGRGVGGRGVGGAGHIIHNIFLIPPGKSFFPFG